MKILRTASLGLNFTGSYYNKKERYIASQLPSAFRPGQLLIKLARYSEKAEKNYYRYCLLARPNFISVFNMLSYLSFLKQLQFLATNRFVASLLLSAFFLRWRHSWLLLWEHLYFTSHTAYIVAVARLVFPFGFPWDSHGFSIS